MIIPSHHPVLAVAAKGHSLAIGLDAGILLIDLAPEPPAFPAHRCTPT
jgi:hypothetical protein